MNGKNVIPVYVLTHIADTVRCGLGREFYMDEFFGHTPIRAEAPILAGTYRPTWW